VKLFAWIGGLALFLGVIFFVKYAFDNNLITPVTRVLAGGAIGLALIVTGIFSATRRYRVPAQSLCATGVLILYGDIYAAFSFYDLISLTAASALMWIVTAAALFLASHLDAQSTAWLAIIGGFLTPLLLWTRHQNTAALFGYIGVLNLGVAALSALKRWHYLMLLAAVGSICIEFGWVADFFGPMRAGDARIIFLAIEAEFVAICIARRRSGTEESWSVTAAAFTGFATLIFCIVTFADLRKYDADFIFPILLFANAGLISLALIGRANDRRSNEVPAILGTALVLTWLAEWIWHSRAFRSDDPVVTLTWYVALFLLFAATPYFCGVKKLWPWMIGAMAGPLQFWLVYRLVVTRFQLEWKALIPLAFALPAAAGMIFLVRKERVPLSSGDSRLAVQGAVVLSFVSLVFPIQFRHEWITLGWAVEGLALVLLFHWIPNPRLRAVALIIGSAAFARLVLNPAVFEYHARSGVRIWNWYFYVYGIAAVCFFLSGRCFGIPGDKPWQRAVPALFYAFAGVTCFFLMNIEIADYFSTGPTLTFSFDENFARDMSYTIAWALFAFGLVTLGIANNARFVRYAGIALFFLALAKLFLHDLASLNQLYRIGAFITVAVIAILASFAYQRFLSPSSARR
jgi:hypothetical protein